MTDSTGVEPTDVRFDSVAFASRQLSDRSRRQAGQAASAAQHALGNDLPGRDARGRCCRSSQEPRSHVLHLG